MVRKDSFPLARIDQLVDATAGHELLSFMDAYSGYNQIFMHPSDSEHTAFITDKRLYCYNVMPFGLKNAGATYQRLVNRIFARYIGNIMEVYVDDMLVKSRTTEEHLHNLSIMFGILKDYRMRLNPMKCAFGVSSEKFLGFMISHRGIEANPEKIKAIIDIERPKTTKDIQSLTGRVAALTRFISKATDNTAVSSVLIRIPEKAELSIFYVSKALQNAELRYPPLEQLALALMWAIELGEFNIQFISRPAKKGQAIADFISEPVTEIGLPNELDAERFDHSTLVWILHVDGLANQQGCGAGLVLTTPDGLKIEYALRFDFLTSNNEAEYEALLAGLRLAKSMNAKQIRIHSDSQLIVNQVTADFAAKDASMHAYLSTTHQLLQSFRAYEIKQIPRSENSHADALARLASAINDKIGRKVPVEILAQPSTVASETCAVRYEDTWMSPIYSYLTNGTLPEDKAQARKLRYRSVRYTVINDVLYKRGYTTPYLKCLTAEQGDYVLWEIHNGVCGDHFGFRFGIPYAIITDNGRQFDSELFRQFYTRLKINLFFASPTHPQSNGQVEAVNKIIKKLLKRQLDKAKGAWPEKLPEALWAIRTSYRTSTGETPFSLTFGSEAVVPVEIGKPSYQTKNFAPKPNEEAISLSLDLLEEHRAHANLRNEAYKQRVSRYCDSRVRHRSFRIEDWVMRKVSLATKDATEGTLGPSWEGPYEIISILRSGTYRLRDSNGKTLSHPWNVEHLKCYFK
ncbi:uncharacterized protein LOC117635292 [Prunus dulcis]|uniref:uncharacterized protein LOC117635292 n=1 Tax=Prunus dulcis TaxID=3755 RepID=UPI001481FDBE|nr:uncharacterized protein LOC117635292 [Prunus dulcis]